MVQTSIFPLVFGTDILSSQYTVSPKVFLRRMDELRAS